MIALQLKNIEEYGKFISFCINNKIDVRDCKWNEYEKDYRVYCISDEYNRAFCGNLRSYKLLYNKNPISANFILNNLGKYVF